MAVNVVVLDKLLSGLLTAKGKDIMTAYNNINETNYPIFAQCFTALSTAATEDSVNGIRLLFCEADGTVIYDSGKRASATIPVDLNTRDNYIDKSINENHNSRIAILKALLSASGRGYEVKRSTSSSGSISTESYVAVRLGTSSENSVGTMRISYRV